MSSIHQVAEAFSSHRFSEAYDHLAADVRWVLVGGSTIEGRDAVIRACEETASGLEQVTATFLKFRSVVGTDAVAVDAVGRYLDANEAISVVSSCDIYEFSHDTIVSITSYTVELEAAP